jgi:hypothetical protein
MSDEKRVTLLHASRHRPERVRQLRGDHVDDYDGVQVTVCLDYLRSQPVVTARLSDQDALALAAELVGAVHARLKHPA